MITMIVNERCANEALPMLNKNLQDTLKASLTWTVIGSKVRFLAFALQV